jgi:hypothetical protein
MVFILLYKLNSNLNCFFSRDLPRVKLTCWLQKSLETCLCHMYQILLMLSDNGMQEWTTMWSPFLGLLASTRILMDACFFFMTMTFEFWNLRDVKAYLEDYQFKIQSKWVIVNGLHWTSLESKSRKVTFYLKPFLTFKLYYFDHILFFFL